MYDIIIIGAGPAGLAAGFAAAGYRLRSLIVATEAAVLGEPEHEVLFGLPQLLDLLKQKESFNREWLELWHGKPAVLLERNIVSFSVEMPDGQPLYAQSVIIATGSGPEGSVSRLESLTIKDGQGRIKTDSEGRTSVPGMFAAGTVSIQDCGTSELAIYSGIRAASAAKDFLHSRLGATA